MDGQRLETFTVRYSQGASILAVTGDFNSQRSTLVDCLAKMLKQQDVTVMPDELIFDHEHQTEVRRRRPGNDSSTDTLDEYNSGTNDTIVLVDGPDLLRSLW